MQLIESLSGVRGTYPDGLDEKRTRAYAHVFANHLLETVTEKPISVVVGMDIRSSGPALKNEFKDVFMKRGFCVYDLEISTTPMTEFAVRELKAHGGVMITGSHNEPHFNGWKMLGPSGAILESEISKKIIDQVHRELESGNEFKGPADEAIRGTVVERRAEIMKQYVHDLLRILGEPAMQRIRSLNLKIVVDPNGGPVIEIINDLFSQLDIECITVNAEAGVFKRTIEPTVETLRHLVPIIDRERADFGCGFDADADRVEIVIESRSAYAQEYGPMVSGNYVLALCVDSVLGSRDSRMSGSDIVVVNNATSNLIHEIAQQYQVPIQEVDVGEINVVTEMRRLKSPIGGEGSSGGAIERSTTCRDGLVSILLLLKLIAREGKSLDQILSTYPRHYDERAMVSCEPEHAATVRLKLIEHFQNQTLDVQTQPGSQSGIKVLFDQDHWLFFRGSQTEPGVFRIIANGRDQEKVTEILREGKRVFNGL